MNKKNSMCPVVAGIVTFNPDIDRLKQNIEAVYSQVDMIIIVDNHSNNVENIIGLVNKYNYTRIVCNTDNCGIAKALNQILGYADDNDAEWVLTLDQDSVVFEGLVQNYLKYIKLPKVGMMTCNIIDRNKVDYSTKENGKEYIEVDKCFTSGCFTKVSAWKEAGGFDERMFIDYVDYDLCLSIREKGYRIIQIAFDGILHELGHSKNVKFLGRKWVVSNHSPFRKYFIVRNRLYYIQKHATFLNVWLERRHLLGFIVLTIFREPNKMKNIKAMTKGLIDYWKM